MKSLHPIVSGLTSLGLLCFALVSAQAAESEKPLVAHARTVTPAVAVPARASAVELPLSTFAIPRKDTEGRDPFFPNSTRVFSANTVVTNRPVSVATDLVLKGISGTPEQPLAIINTTTFTSGETSEVIVKNGRYRVQCVEINMSMGTVLLQIGSERRELRLGQK